jgi:hypothetical protein
MRIQFSDLNRPKQAAKYLTRAGAELSLAIVHEALARALGYRDWHELSITARLNNLAATEQPSIEDAVNIILDLADALVLPEADVQHAVSKARLLRATPWTINDHMLMRTSIWRQRVFGTAGRGKSGTVVRDRAYNSNTPAYLRYPGRPTYLLFDTGFGERADFEVVTFTTPRLRALANLVTLRGVEVERRIGSPILARLFAVVAYFERSCRALSAMALDQRYHGGNALRGS